MPEILDGQTVEVQGSAAKPYQLKNIGGVYSCSCPAWRNQSLPIDRRSCKHLRQYRSAAAEAERLGSGSGDTIEKTSETDTAKPSPPALLLAETWDQVSDLSGWWLSEKLDGVRAYWDGTRFLSRQGNLFHAPAWFTAGLPSVPLDGELWLGRKSFQRTVSTVRRQDAGELWRELRYSIFDLPGFAAPFEGRLQALENLIERHQPVFVGPLPQVRCRGESHLRGELERIISLGGEGLMLREPGSRYEAKRSTTLLKVKQFHDAEATVLEHLPGKGRQRGRLGALLVTLPDGTEFQLGSGLTDAQRESPPAIGSVVTFRYQELTNAGVPRFPTFVRVRAE